VQRYRARISGPLLDRIDLHVEVPRVPHALLGNTEQASVGESSKTVRARVSRARERQVSRTGKTNSALSAAEIKQHLRLTEIDLRLLEQASDKLGFSARGYHKILKLARTIADLAASEQLETTHLTEAIGYRVLDRKVGY
jgi:magnesium chelatase family protein